MTNLFVVAALLSILELAFLHLASPKKIELTIVDAVPTAIVYSNYFFLPFTTKIRKYKDIKKAYISSRIQKDKYSTYKVYDLVLEYSNRSVILFRGKQTEENLLKYCDKINQFIASFEDCVVYESKIMKLKIALVFALFLLPLCCFIAPVAIQNDYYLKDTEYLYCLYGYLITTAIVTIFILLSLTVNRYKNSLGEKKVISQIYKINNNANKTKKKIDANSEAQRVYDSIIK